MARHDIHITPSPTGWKANLDNEKIIMTPTKKEITKIVFQKAADYSPCYVFIHKKDGSVQNIRFFKSKK